MRLYAHGKRRSATGGLQFVVYVSMSKYSRQHDTAASQSAWKHCRRNHELDTACRRRIASKSSKVCSAAGAHTRTHTSPLSRDGPTGRASRDGSQPGPVRRSPTTDRPTDGRTARGERRSPLQILMPGRAQSGSRRGLSVSLSTCYKDLCTAAAAYSMLCRVASGAFSLYPAAPGDVM